MQDITLIILAAGSSTRFNKPIKKQWIRVDEEPLWLYVTNKIASYSSFHKIVVASHKDELEYMKNFSNNINFIEGGRTRQESIKNSLSQVDTKYVMISDMARVNIPKSIVKELIENKTKAHCIVPFINVSDTVVYKDKTINKDEIKLIQTPQLSLTSKLKESLKSNVIFTDDSSLIKSNNGTIKYIKGDIKSHKLTFQNDIKSIDNLKSSSKNIYTGIGLDTHAFEENIPMFLGGIKIDVPYGFKAHSDGDVLIHSLIDSLLGACGAGDIGEFFPDTSIKYKNISSTLLLEKIINFIYNIGYEINNIDITLIAQKPKLQKYKKSIKTNLAKIINIKPIFINIKATTSEELGFIGRSEGISVHSISSLRFYDWKNDES